MKLLDKLLAALGLSRQRKHTYNFSEELIQSLHILAEREQRSDDEIASDLLASALARQVLGEDALRRWEGLSFREQQVVSLLVLDYTNRQIAAFLGLSTETVKSHVAHVLHKFDLHSRSALRNAMQGWELEAWRQANLDRPVWPIRRTGRNDKDE